VQPHSVLGVQPEQLRRLGDVGDRLGQRLALLQRLQPGELVAALVDLVRDATADGGPIPHVHGGPLALRGVGGGNRGVEVGRDRQRDGPHVLAGDRADHVERLGPGAGGEVTVDEQPLGQGRGGHESYLPRTAAGGFHGPSAISLRTYSITASMILFAWRRVPAAATSRAPSPMIEVRMLA
jgi:hypothetical protein